jgi:hypothetical protein
VLPVDDFADVDVLADLDVLADVPVLADVDLLADADAFGLDDGEVLFLGVAEIAVEVVDTTACAVGVVELAQDGLEVGWPLVRLLELELETEVGLGLGLWLGLGLLVAVGVLCGLGLPLTLALALALAEALAVALALALAEALALAVVLLRGLLLAEVAGAAVVALVRPGEVVFACVADAAADEDDDETQGLGELATATALGLLDGAPSAVEGCGAAVPPPSVAPGPFDELLLLLLKAEPIVSPTFTNAWRAGGTSDRTTPTANTAAPTANAGRSIASRQSLRGRGAGCSEAWRAWRARPRRRARPAAKPEIASQRPSAPLGRVTRAGRDRILSRIRSRPSPPGST